MTATAVIDLDALRHNVRVLAQKASPAEVMLAVKADAYGHGIIPIAQAGLTAGATSLAVLEIPAGLALRRAGITVPLFAWLHGMHTDFAAGIEADIELGISAAWQLQAIADAGADRPAVVHLKVDTGLSRNGASLEDWPALIDLALELERRGVLRVRAAWTHLADASVEADEDALALFHGAVQTAKDRGASFEILHMAASSAGIRMPEARFDLVRFGIAAYGISPFDDQSGADLGLRPVMSLRAPVISVDGSVATVAAGFGDGVHALGAGKAAVLLGDARCRVLTVDVDTMTVRVESGATPGDEIVVFGDSRRGEPTAEQWADWSETIGDEIVTRVSARVPRTYLNG
ncbi:alanine racemase [Diaminobutyricimonas sp. TR449]|uniref:alanine racemase n=1 Tax=Diaminobutyricimonas sp. TR449 TaxID=2708076 RepID=UPI00142495A6|nr:alanine racemase [Diaminobutyricimonas sp. TR449]